ncbi:hypothetical protein A946_02100 [Methylacidiphilum kamchatkense Kam1]|uniref:CRISPR type III-B/RAMP module RAMP protein Cmr6 n=1 Tax=Methylacidiphilum kamchatkense Kam1 TaxID=1202785 RepID=A0ABR4ZZ61_9BACT|nr:hypothetical protein A946_02100 [Methylacidiphilum kamchatkense Kam1]
MDVICCHHENYYKGQIDNATDDEAPNPVFFPAIAPGLYFAFVLLPIEHRRVIEEGADLLSTAKLWLAERLQCFDIGAKTAADYGKFDCNENDRIKQSILQVNKRKSIKPDPKWLDKLSKLKEDEHRGKIKPFSYEEEGVLNDEKLKDEICQISLFKYLIEINPDLYQKEKTTKILK